MLTDLRHALRVLRKSPAFTIVSVLVLAVAIGGTTAMFTIVNALLLRPLPLESPADLVRVYSKTRPPGGGYHGISHPHYVELRERNTAFSDLTAFTFTMIGDMTGDTARRSMAALVPSNYFSTLGVPLAAGRGFTPEEERPGAAIPVAVVSHGTWRRLGADPGLVGRTVLLNSREFRVVGIAPEGFGGITALLSPDFWLPFGVFDSVSIELMNERRLGLDDWENQQLLLVGRLRPGVTTGSARAQLEALASRLSSEHPASLGERTLELGPLTRLALSTQPMRESPLSVVATLLLAMSGTVLLIACLNIANMLLARGTTRRREVAVRVALGGARWRIVRQLLVEALVLALAGGAVGLIMASWATDLLAASMAPKIPLFTVVFDSRPDWNVLAATCGFCVASVVFFGLGPAWRLARTDVMSNLKEQPEDELGRARGGSVFAPRNLLVVGQIALSLALLTGAGLFMRGAINAAQGDPGFSFDDGILAEVDASFVGYGETRGRQLFSALQERLAALPGVQSASYAALVPFGLVQDSRRVAAAGAPAAPEAAGGEGGQAEIASVDAGLNVVATDYFRTLGVPLLRGREFERVETESATAGRVAIIDEPLARRLWPDEDPIGRQILLVRDRQPDPQSTMEVIGVVAGLRDDLSQKEPGPHLYLPFGQEFRSGVHFHLKIAPGGAGAEAALVRAVRGTIRDVDPLLPVLRLETLRSFHDDGLQVWMARTGARLFTVFGAIALFLAVVGVYGVKAYVVARRTREIGIRMALGATRRDVLALVLREGLVLTLTGLGIGLLLAMAANAALSGMLYEVGTLDPLVLPLASLLLAAAAMLACYLPARRAAWVEPMRCLRDE